MKRRKFRRRLVEAIANRTNRPLLYGALFLIAAAATALACGWSYVTDHSVRFNTYRTGRGFYRLPPLPIMYDKKTGKDVSAKEIDIPNESDYLENEAPEPSLWERANALVQQNDLSEAKTTLQKYLNESSEAYSDSGGQQSRRNSAYDMLDAIAALKAGSKIEAVREYLDARDMYHNSWHLAQEGEFPSPSKFTDKNLEDNWEYLKAAALYSKKLNQEALQAFEKHVADYPRSEKNEAALYMIGKIHLESSNSYEKDECETAEASTNPAEDGKEQNCTDENWHAAVKAFQQLASQYPDGRYSKDARSWLAYLNWHGGDQALAVAEYYRLLAHPTDRNARVSAKRSLQYLGHDFDEAILDRVEQLIADSPDTALAYAYHRIYNHAVDLSYTEYDHWCCYDENTHWQDELKEKKRVKDTHDAGSHELERIARFATRMMKRYPNSKVSGAFALRVAEAQLELDNFAEAQLLAQKALNLGLKGDNRAEALWVKGSSHHYQKDFKAARTTFFQLASEFPHGRLTEGARRLLALTAEDQDDLETALEQYLILNYEYDVAYYVDVLLPTDRLAKFVSDRKQDSHSDYLLYALGVRLLRDKKWNDARTALRKVRTVNTPPNYDSIYGENESSFVKEPDWGEQNRQEIKTTWVMQDLKTIDALEYLEKAIETASDDEAKAEAMYHFASFQFEGDDLLFYNPAAWKGQRYWLLDQLAESNSVRFVNENQTIFEHSQSHEGLSRAITIYLEIATRFPDTRAAKDAMYSAAVAHERVSNLNPYWRNIYSRGLFAGPRNIGFGDVKSMFPKYRFPRSSEGWEPSTRTVNGGPGWEPKPKPAPPLTRTQRFERRVKYVYGKFQMVVMPRIDAFTNWVGSGLSGYISVITYVLSWLLTIVALLMWGYVALLGFHYRATILAFARRLSASENGLEQLPASDSRIEKVIDDDKS